MKSLFTIALLTAGLQALHLNTDNSLTAIAHSTLSEEIAANTPSDSSQENKLVVSQEEITDISLAKETDGINALESSLDSAS